MALLKKKEKIKDVNLEKDEQDTEDDIGGKIVLGLVALFIVLIWIGIFIILVKFDVGGFGSTVLRPILKDVPYLNWVLPKEDVSNVDKGNQYESVDEAVLRIKELEKKLDEALATNASDAETITQLQEQINELNAYKEEQDVFEKTKEKFYEEVVFSDQSPDIEEYKTYYESIDPENAEVLYKQVVEQIEYDREVRDYAKTYSSMKAKEAAAIFDTMTNDLKLVADILENMSTASRAAILGKMDPKIAAKVTAIMEPD